MMLSGLAAMVRQESTTVLPRREFLGVATTAVAVPMIADLAGGSRVGAEMVEHLLLNTARLRRLDDFLGGADTYSMFAAEVHATARLLQSCTYQESVGRRLLAVLAEQAQLAGWAAFDAGWQAEAHHMFAMSLQAARDAGDPPLVGNAMAFVGYQGLMLGRSAVTELTNATETAKGHATRTVRAMLHCRRAWAHANEGLAGETQRHLDIAQAALRESSDRPEPDWVYWVDELEHEIMTGRCWAALRRPMRAIAALEKVLRDYEDTHGRDKALYLSFLADAYLDANELEQACAVASRAIDLSAGVGSIRPRMRIESVMRRVNGSAQCVRELRAKVQQWLSLRQLSPAPSPDTPAIPQQATRR
jgi:tetratricopeptide (TPR) repeat protein